MEKLRRFVKNLLRWSEKNLRRYPWRKTKDPYKILIAEIMLQRTRGDQVVQVFKNFIQKYPDARTLADSPIEDIRSTILSLGLEKRAYGLKRLAEQLASRHGGRVPDKEKELLNLYGVGRYIANAVLCHAYGKSVPTVDANFARVLKRVFSLKTKDPAQKDKSVWEFARKIMPFAEERFREINLAVIDLANLICKPRNPECNICPLNDICDYTNKQ